MTVHHDLMFVQERIETLRRAAEQERLANELRTSRRAATARQEQEEATRRDAGRARGLRRVLRWGAGA
jgi:uncharacterized SAM-binding protein YcdF (DUF218 family)